MKFGFTGSGQTLDVPAGVKTTRAARLLPRT